MKISTVSIGNYLTPNNIFLAPMAGYTDYAFRHLAISLGAGLTFTELVSAKGLVYESNKTLDLLYTGEDTSKTAVQIFGHEPYYMRKAIESKALEKFDIIDINMGCPVNKIYKNGDGSALLENIFIAENVIEECVKTGKIITVKIRTGVHFGDDVSEEYSKMAENAGAKLITIHARVKDAFYSGEPDYNAIYKAKRAVKIPVIANGGILTEEDAEKMIEKTGADGVMLARGAISNPFLFSKLLKKDATISLKDFIFNQLEINKNLYGDNKTAIEFRKFAPYYFKGERNSKDLRILLSKASTVQEIYDIINKNL